MLADSYDYETDGRGVYRFETPEAAFEVKTLATQILENGSTPAVELLNPSPPAIVRTNGDELKINNYEEAPEAVEKAAAVLQGDDDFKELGEWYDE
ncbi:MAG: hypothetical protein ABEJ98_05405 [Candidatus Nanohaloarchaea archaeon]